MIHALQHTAERMLRACRSTCLPVVFLCAGLYSPAQNQTTPDGFNTGPWTEEYESASGVFRDAGAYQYKKAIYPPENKDEPVEIYYPEDNLVIPDAELSFYSVFGINTFFTYIS